MHIIKNEYLHMSKNEYLHENNQNLNKNGSMATMAEKMAASLEELRKLQEKDRCVVLQGTAEIGRTHLTRLLDNGWLQEVMKGWYIAARPGTEGDTTIWYTSFWYFIAKYAAVRLGEQWCLTADQSLDLYSGKVTTGRLSMTTRLRRGVLLAARDLGTVICSAALLRASSISASICSRSP